MVLSELHPSNKPSGRILIESGILMLSKDGILAKLYLINDLTLFGTTIRFIILEFSNGFSKKPTQEKGILTFSNSLYLLTKRISSWSNFLKIKPAT